MHEHRVSPVRIIRCTISRTSGHQAMHMHNYILIIMIFRLKPYARRHAHRAHRRSPPRCFIEHASFSSTRSCAPSAAVALTAARKHATPPHRHRAPAERRRGLRSAGGGAGAAAARRRGISHYPPPTASMRRPASSAAPSASTVPASCFTGFTQRWAG